MSCLIVSLDASSPLCFMQIRRGWVGGSKHNCLCILFIRLTTCFGHCGPSSVHKNIERKENIQYKNISYCAYSELSTRSRCLAVVYIETNNIFDR